MSLHINEKGNAKGTSGFLCYAALQRTTHSLLACQIRRAGMNQKGKISVLPRGRVFGWRKAMPPVDLDHRHCQEIIMEIGYRLGAALRRENTIVSPRLEQLLEALRDQERTQRSV